MINNNRVYIIAECGVNHEGDIEIAKKMICAAKESGADAVKFTCYITENYINKNYKERFELAKKFELTKKNFIDLKKISDKENIDFILTPLCFETLGFASNICDIIKISSGDITNTNFLYAAANLDKQIILSTGASTFDEIKNAVEILEYYVCVNILHCVASYPTPLQNTNLNSILFLKEKFPNNNIGYSDHTNDTFACECAVILGAKIIEKHFTLDRNDKEFHDHFLSSNPIEFKEMVDKIRMIPYMLGEKDKTLQMCEIEKRNYLRRGMIAVQDIKAGESITGDKFKMVRPQI